MTEAFRKCKRVFLAGIMGAAMAITMTNFSLAADHEGDCHRRIHTAEEKVHKAVERHGEHSPQAESARRELDRVQKNCGDVH